MHLDCFKTLGTKTVKILLQNEKSSRKRKPPTPRSSQPKRRKLEAEYTEHEAAKALLDLASAIPRETGMHPSSSACTCVCVNACMSIQGIF